MQEAKRQKDGMEFEFIKNCETLKPPLNNWNKHQNYTVLHVNCIIVKQRQGAVSKNWNCIYYLCKGEVSAGQAQSYWAKQFAEFANLP